MLVVADVMDELDAALDSIDGLRSHPYETDKVTPPAAIVHWPESIDFDSTMSRGSDLVNIPVTVVVGRSDQRSSRDRLSKYLDGSGPDSIKTVIETHESTAWDSARVVKAEIGAVTIANVTYLSATFDVELVV